MNGVSPEELREKIAAYHNETIATMQSKDSDIKALTEKVADLEQKLAAKECKGCDNPTCSCNSKQKEASLEKTAVDGTVDKIIQAGFLKEAQREQALQAIADDPAGSLLDFLDKLASQRIQNARAQADMMPKLGHAVETGQETASALDVRDSDRSFEQTFDNLAAAPPA